MKSHAMKTQSENIKTSLQKNPFMHTKDGFIENNKPHLNYILTSVTNLAEFKKKIFSSISCTNHTSKVRSRYLKLKIVLWMIAIVMTTI